MSKKAKDPKKLTPFRLRLSVRKALSAMKRTTGKDMTRLVEEAVMMHAKELVNRS